MIKHTFHLLLKIFLVTRIHGVLSQNQTTPGTPENTTGPTGGNVDSFYDECTTGRTCFGIRTDTTDKSTDCTNDRSCTFVTSVKKLDRPSGNTNIQHDQPTYEIIASFDHSKAKYLAVGIGRTGRMKNLAVLECVTPPEGSKIVGYTSWVGKYKVIPTRSNATPIIELTRADVDGNRAMCVFKVPAQFELSGSENSGIKNVDLSKESYHILLAWGPVTGTDTIGYHEPIGTLASGTKINFNVISTHIEAEDLGRSYRLHGILMTIVYMGLMPVGTIIARFYKETWTSIKIFNKKLWLVVHMTLMCLSLFFVVIAYFSIVLQTGKWWPENEIPSTSQDHAILGTASLVMLVLQVTGPWFIPQTKLLLKKIYFFTHAMQGLACYVLGIANIALASSWVSFVQPCEGVFVTSIWIATHLSIYILLTALLYIKDFELEEPPKNCRALTSYPMKIQTLEDAPGGSLRKILLTILIISSIITCISMYVMIFEYPPCQKV